MNAHIERYYRFHARIYDATRWSFLFGRTALIEKVAAHHKPTHILDVGCGTGKNLLALCSRFPHAAITGLDLSAEMLERARANLGRHASRVELLQRAYDRPLKTAFDLILFSYSLSMMNPGWEHAIDYAHRDLEPGGLIAVVDFHDSALLWFRRWMAVNHVRLDGHLLPELQARFRSLSMEVQPAYAGWWKYLLFIGAK